MEIERLKYPIGKFVPPDVITPQIIRTWITEIEQLPATLNGTLEGISERALDTPYRPEGWTVRQVVHHLADSHINSYIRFRWTLTEDTPVIKAYNQAEWAKLPDAIFGDVNLSVRLLEAVHARWLVLLKVMTMDDMERSYIHPESNAEFKLSRVVGLYAWHGKHHLAHIQNLLKSL
ncbi:MAG: putative metal-dependent hydrolase [Cyclobacteriaceae bacterium]|nr:putative metal-dependent hydrolase [Cyclobacteriaceae bacterium]